MNSCNDPDGDWRSFAFYDQNKIGQRFGKTTDGQSAGSPAEARNSPQKNALAPSDRSDWIAPTTTKFVSRAGQRGWRLGCHIETTQQIITRLSYVLQKYSSTGPAIAGKLPNSIIFLMYSALIRCALKAKL